MNPITLPDPLPYVCGMLGLILGWLGYSYFKVENQITRTLRKFCPRTEICPNKGHKYSELVVYTREGLQLSEPVDFRTFRKNRSRRSTEPCVFRATVVPRNGGGYRVHFYFLGSSSWFARTAHSIQVSEGTAVLTDFNGVECTFDLGAYGKGLKTDTEKAQALLLHILFLDSYRTVEAYRLQCFQIYISHACASLKQSTNSPIIEQVGRAKTQILANTGLRLPARIDSLGDIDETLIFKGKETAST